jgi:exodeoxyribonuclease-5
MSNFALTPDQQDAHKALVNFLLHPTATKFILRGYAGTGKSTLVNTFLQQLPTTLKAMSFITQQPQDWDVLLTATTNKATEALTAITGEPVRTIQSALELRVETDYKTRSTRLVTRSFGVVLENTILLIDEASFIDDELDGFITSRTRNCKIIFIGDSAQIVAFKANKATVFQSGYPGAELTEVVRQAKGNPIIELATSFRNTVNNGQFTQFTPDGHHVQYLTRDNFNDAIVKEFTHPDWKQTGHGI